MPAPDRAAPPAAARDALLTASLTPSITALIVRVDAADALLGDLRARFDPDAALGAPARVTVLVPFLPPARIDAAVLARLRAAVASVPAFELQFARIGRWPEGTWLAPEPAAPLVALTRAVWAAFPECPPYEGRFAEIVPHLTVAYGSSAEAEACARELAPRLARQRAERGPLRLHCGEVELIALSGGRWRTQARLPLGAPGPA